MKAFYSFLLLVAVALTACDEEITNKLIQLADGTSTSLVFNADESGDATIKFTADAAWTASVSEVAASKSGESISWLKLSSYGGEAGENTITVSLLKNYTGAFRKAEIKIACGDSEIVITVEQKGEASTGTVVKKIKEIVYKETENSEIDLGNEPDNEEFLKTFSYDEDGRVARIKETGRETSENSSRYTSTLTFDYSIVGEIQVVEEKKYQESDSEKIRYIVKLDDRGNAVKLDKKEEYDSDFSCIAEFGYTDDVRLGKIKYSDGYEWETYLFGYENGFMKRYTRIPEYGEEYTTEFSDSFYENKYRNNCMADMMAFLYFETDVEFLFYIGRLSKTSDYFVETMLNDEDEAMNAGPDGYPAEDDGKTETYPTVEFADSKIKCEYDTDDNLTKVEESIAYEVIEKSYTIKVYTDQKPVRVEDGIPYYPGDRIYGPDKKIKDGTDYYTYTINY